MTGRPGIERLWRRDLAPTDRLLRMALTPFSGCYRTILACRSAWWRVMAQAAPVTVISVGNLTVGGNGKTPLTLFLANRLAARGYRVGIVSRGYGAKLHNGVTALVVAHGQIFLSVGEAGDEPLMMAHRFDGPIAVARRRIHGIALLLAKYPLDAVILDDAFQHIRLRRDLDVVAVNGSRGLGNSRLLPAGPLREPASAMSRAGMIVIVGERGENTVDFPPTVLDKQILRAQIQTRSLVQLSRGLWSEGPLALQRKRVLAVSGIADPDGFASILMAQGAHVLNHLAFPDHHAYSAGDWATIRSAARDADLVMTTEKDLVKLERLSPPLPSLRALRLDINMSAADEGRLIAAAADCIERRRQTTVSTVSLARASIKTSPNNRRVSTDGLESGSVGHSGLP